MNHRFVIITGGDGAIASHIARRLHDEGAKILLWTHDHHDRADRLPLGRISSDLSDAAASQKAWDDWKAAHDRRPDALIHTAAVRASDHQPLRDSSPEMWARVAMTNLNMAANILRMLLPELALADPGRVVLFGSDVSRSGLCSGSAYAAAKAGIVALARSVALEERNVLVNVVSPGPVETDFSNGPEEYLEFRRRYFEEQISQTPLGRLAAPDDLYGLVRHLISPENTFLTGEEVFLNGGRG
jgi:NAD(P)-dependent dehydrogenase (short-subunit alcohol dehydrogenase family)